MLTVLGQGEGFVAVDKPAGRLVIPGRQGPEAERDLRAEVEAQLGRPLWVVHRLDRDTSGVLLFATDAAAHRVLSRAFERHLVAKRYLALCAGTLFGSGQIDRPLVPIRGGRVRVATSEEDGRAGKASITHWRAVERWGTYTLVEFRPATGRLHQIRAHAASLGHPLAVDPAYGGADRLAFGDVVLSRVPLHAASLKFPPPAGGTAVVVEAPLPSDLVCVFAHLRGQAVGGVDSVPFPSGSVGDNVRETWRTPEARPTSRHRR